MNMVLFLCLFCRDTVQPITMTVQNPINSGSLTLSETEKGPTSDGVLAFSRLSTVMSEDESGLAVSDHLWSG